MTTLTPRELECIAAVREHGTMKAAAFALGISIRTLEVHLAKARAKKNVHRTWQLFLAA